MILEDSKEEDVSFSKTLTGHSPIPKKYNYMENKSSVDEGTRSLLKHMRNNSLESNDAFKNSTLGNGGPTISAYQNSRPSFNIQEPTENSNIFRNNLGNKTSGN